MQGGWVQAGPSEAVQDVQMKGGSLYGIRGMERDRIQLARMPGKGSMQWQQNALPHRLRGDGIGLLAHEVCVARQTASRSGGRGPEYAAPEYAASVPSQPPAVAAACCRSAMDEEQPNWAS